jgi:hypothetical protein
MGLPGLWLRETCFPWVYAQNLPRLDHSDSLGRPTMLSLGRLAGWVASGHGGLACA